jgi:hypothetical protein
MTEPRTKYVLRRARQPHVCTECRCSIEVKVTYLFAAMPPEHEFNNSKPRRWYMQKVCPRCIERGRWTVPERKSRAGKSL